MWKLQGISVIIVKEAMSSSMGQLYGKIVKQKLAEQVADKINEDQADSVQLEGPV